MIALSISIVTSVVLLSNDMRHLRSFLSAFGYGTVPRAQTLPAVSRQMTPVPPLAVTLPPRLLSPDSGHDASAFLRTWRQTGAQICSALDAAGIKVGEWANAPISIEGTNECSYERSWSDGPLRRSVFYLIRGNSAGSISTARVKLVNPVVGPNGRMDPALLRDLLTLLQIIGWPDLGNISTEIADLKDTSSQAFGSLLTFKREPTSRANFNLIISLGAPAASDAKTRTYFARDNWLPAYWGSETKNRFQ